MEIEIKEFKNKIVEYFKGIYCYDVTLLQLLKDLKLDIKDLDKLEFCLGELVNEGWVKKSSSMNHYEYDPGKKLDFGGLQG